MCIFVVYKSFQMILLTFIGRVTDGLPLSASIQEDEKTGRELVEYQNQAKQLLKRLTVRSPQQCSLGNSENTSIFVLNSTDDLYARAVYECEAVTYLNSPTL